MERTSLLGLSGSLRAESYSTGILRSLEERLPRGVELRIHDLGNLPLYNQDLDVVAAPEAVLAFRRAMATADGLVIVTPEFNYGIPGVLKNALDWASRPYGAAALNRKPVVTISASPAFTGGARAQGQLHETLLATQSIIVPRPQTVIGEVHKKFEEGKLVDAPAMSFALDAIEDLLTLVRQNPGRLAA